MASLYLGRAEAARLLLHSVSHKTGGFMNLKRLAALAALACGTALPASAGQTFDAVKAKGFVQCAVNTGLAGFSFSDSQGKWTGLDVDLCKAIAAALFGDAEKVKFTPTTAQQRFVALQSGEVDVITRNATQTLQIGRASCRERGKVSVGAGA